MLNQVCVYFGGFVQLQKATVEQMMKTGEMIRSVCIGKAKASEELVNQLKESKFPDAMEVKCYVNCALEMMQAVSFFFCF